MCSNSSTSSTLPAGSCAPTRVACVAGSTSARVSSGSRGCCFLDEPTTGLDPRSRIELWDAIRSLVEAGTDVLLTTQYLDEADQLAGQIVIIDHGRTIAVGTPAELKRQVGGNVIEVHTRRRDQLATIAEALARLDHGNALIDEATHRVTVGIDGAGDGPSAALSALDAVGVEIDDIALRQPTLDEVFLALPDVPQPTTTRADRRAPRRPRPEPRKDYSSMTAIAHDLDRRDERDSTGLVASTLTITRRAALRYLRTPQLIVMATLQMSLFFLIYRYMFGGAIHAGTIPYVDYLVPGFIATGCSSPGSGPRSPPRRISSTASSTGCARSRSRVAPCSRPVRSPTRPSSRSPRRSRSRSRSRSASASTAASSTGSRPSGWWSSSGSPSSGCS